MAHNLTDILDSLLQNKVNKMQPSMNNMMSQGLGSHTLEHVPQQQFNARDFMQGGNQDAITRALGKTPVSLPSIFGLPVQKQQPNLESPSRSTHKESAPIIKQVNESSEDRKERLSREKEERALKSKKQIQIDKETFPYYEKIKKASSTIPEVDARLDEMDALLDTGRVQGPTLIAFLDSLKNLPWFIGKFGDVVGKAVTTEETQIFHKLSQDFLRDAKPYFGSNLSTREVELFLERVPSLMQSEGGRRGVIRNFRALNDYAKAIDQALEDIITENGGERPRHLESKVAARVKPAGDKLRKAFRDSVKLIHKPSENFTAKAYDKAKKKLA